MATSFKLFHDAALTQEISSANPLTATQETGGALGPVDKTIYFGSTATDTKVQAVSSPGVDPIIIDIVDADAGTGAPDTEFKLALSAGGLDTATAGASLSLSHTINSGVASAVPIYTRRTSALTVAGAYTDVSLASVSVIETPV